MNIYLCLCFGVDVFEPVWACDSWDVPVKGEEKFKEKSAGLEHSVELCVNTSQSGCLVREHSVSSASSMLPPSLQG